MKKLIYQGAEAKIFEDNNSVIKERTPKTYRLPEIDERIRKFRTKREAKIMDSLKKAGINAPKIIKIDEKNCILEIEKIEGNLVKDLPGKTIIDLGHELGKIIGIMHSNNIIHGDLTTSNMILKDRKIFLIDFGLSFISSKEEDKAVDLHLLKQALESKHYKIFEKCFAEVEKGYLQEYSDAIHILERLKNVEKRGRNKCK